jgi:hypothetical protein
VEGADDIPRIPMVERLAMKLLAQFGRSRDYDGHRAQTFARRRGPRRANSHARE